MPYTSEKKVFEDAVAIQNASNLSGVVTSFQEAIIFLKTRYPERDVRHHPAVGAMLFKILDMCDYETVDSGLMYGQYLECERRAKE